MKTLPHSCEKCFEEYKLILEELRHYVNQSKRKELSLSHQRELITNFESTHEWALKSIESYLTHQGKGPFSGSRDLTVEAFHYELIDDGKAWLDMIIDRIQYNPLYPIDTQSELIGKINKTYIRRFEKFENTFPEKIGGF